MQGSPFTLFKLEYWIRSCVRGHCFGCSLRPGTSLNSPASWLHLSFRGHWPTDLGATNSPTIVVAQAWCLAIFNLSPTQNTCLFTDGNQASVCEHQPQPITFLSPTSAAGRRTRTFAEADGRNAQTQIRALQPLITPVQRIMLDLDGTRQKNAGCTDFGSPLRSLSSLVPFPSSFTGDISSKGVFRAWF